MDLVYSLRRLVHSFTYRQTNDKMSVELSPALIRREGLVAVADTAGNGRERESRYSYG